MNILEWLSVGSAIMVVGGFVLAHLRSILEIAREVKRTRQLKAFDQLITGAECTSKSAHELLTGKRTIEDEISIFLPGIDADDDLVVEFVEAIHTKLDAEKLGFVIRAITYDGVSSCVDIYLSDFVAGLDSVRRLLPQFDLPSDTTIEYTGGDLPLFDR